MFHKSIHYRCNTKCTLFTTFSRSLPIRILHPERPISAHTAILTNSVSYQSLCVTGSDTVSPNCASSKVTLAAACRTRT